MGNTKFSKWYGLAVIALISAGLGLTLTSFPSLFKEMAAELNLNLAQLGAMWGMTSLAGVAVGIASGLFGDRFGVRIVIGTGCFLAALVISLAGLSSNLVSLLLFIFLYGLSSHLISSNRPKAIRIWFESRQLGMANGICGATFAGAGTVAMLFAATVFSPFLGGWRYVMFLNAAILGVMGFIWFFTIKEEVAYDDPANENGGIVKKVSFGEAFSHVVRIKDVWIVGIASFALVTCAMSLVGYMPVFFEGAGMSSTAAHNFASIGVAGFFVGNFFVPFISDRIGLRKVTFVGSAILIAISVFLVPFLSGPALMVAVFLYGVSGGAASLGAIIVTEMKKVGPTYSGTAVGLAMTLSGLGGVFGPTVGGIIADIDPARPFIFWSVMALVSIIPMLFVKETGYRAKH